MYKSFLYFLCDSFEYVYKMWSSINIFHKKNILTHRWHLELWDRAKCRQVPADRIGQGMGGSICKSSQCPFGGHTFGSSVDGKCNRMKSEGVRHFSRRRSWTVSHHDVNQFYNWWAKVIQKAFISKVCT